MKTKITIEEYLQRAARFAGSDYGKMVRSQFADNKGDSELAMLVAPTLEELEELKRAVAIMTDDEKKNADGLSDEQVHKLAEDAGVDAGNLAIFFNGYALHCKRVS
ncbi:MAG: hypothetical protein H8D47_02500 [Planctomycetes bacterium]|nr:hypothetical protein [Planctomycetota bacterium]MBL7106861.1 hypothetical protein [Phycisphaerae bacterium]